MKFFTFYKVKSKKHGCCEDKMPRQTLIRENTVFPWQKPQQLASAEANFKG